MALRLTTGGWHAPERVGWVLCTHGNRHERDASWRALSMYTIANARGCEAPTLLLLLVGGTPLSAAKGVAVAGTIGNRPMAA